MYDDYQQEDFSKYRYVIYARRSSEESDNRQLRSLPDQIKECKELAMRNGLKVVDVISESMSAKVPHKRAEFDLLLEKITKGKVDGIIAWAPDRLARNMLEAGMIIDMIDNRQIKDVRFSTYPFSRDANGMMLLGLSFVLSKQYSDKLSQDVTRGLHSSFLEGKASGNVKHGYVASSADYYVPDGEMFFLLQMAWQKRLRGETLIEIAKWLNENGYAKTYKNGRKEGKTTKQKLSKIFNDTFYYGVIKIKQLTIDLREIPEADFRPMISESDFFQVQKMVDARGNRKRLRQSNKFGEMLLKGIVRCAECDNACMVYPVLGNSKKRYLYYSCRNPECSRTGKTTRGLVIFEWLYEFLKDGFNVTKKDYEELRTSRKKNIGMIKAKNEATMRQLQIKIDKHSLTIDNTSLKLSGLENKVATKSIGKQLDKLEMEKELMEAELEKRKEYKKELETVDITWENFVNTTKNIVNKLKNADMHQKDALVRTMFVNISVNKEKVVNYTLKEPFLTLLNRNSDEVVTRGWGEFKFESMVFV